MDEFDASTRRALLQDFGETQKILFEDYLASNGATSLLFAKVAQENGDQKPDHTIKIEDVGRRIGVWQQHEYEKLGVQRIRLGQNSVNLELKAAVSKGALFTSLDFEQNFSFQFRKGKDGLTLNNVRGLKIDGDPISSVELKRDSAVFWVSRTRNEKYEFGSSTSEYVRAIIEPLTADYLRQ